MSAKQASQAWNEFLVKIDLLLDLAIKVDKCVFYQISEFFIMHVDNGMFLRKSECQLSNNVMKLQDVGLDIEDQGHPDDYDDVNTWKYDGGSYEFTQCDLIDSITENIGLSYAKATTKPVPTAIQRPLLHAYKDSPFFKNGFNYHSHRPT